MLAMFDDMNVTMELKSGGVVSSKTEMKGKPDPKGDKEEPGTWKKDGDTIIVTQGDKAGKEMKCTKSGKSLSCTAGDEKNKMTLVFAKT